MSSHVIRVGAWHIDGRDLDLTVIALKLAADMARRDERAEGASLAQDFERLLRDAMDARLEACAPQATQVARGVVAPEWQPTDLITVKEAAKLMDCSTSNIRQMYHPNRRTLWSTVVSGRTMVSRSECQAKARAGCGAS